MVVVVVVVVVVVYSDKDISVEYGCNRDIKHPRTLVPPSSPLHHPLYCPNTPHPNRLSSSTHLHPASKLHQRHLPHPISFHFYHYLSPSRLSLSPRMWNIIPYHRPPTPAPPRLHYPRGWCGAVGRGRVVGVVRADTPLPGPRYRHLTSCVLSWMAEDIVAAISQGRKLTTRSAKRGCPGVNNVLRYPCFIMLK